MKIPLLVFALAGLPLSAQPALEALPPDSSFTAGKPPSPASPSLNQRTPGKALVISVSATAVPVLAGILMANYDPSTLSDTPEELVLTGTFVGLAGLLFGPSAGQFWIRDHKQAATGLAIRTLGFGLLWAAAAGSGGGGDVSGAAFLGVLVTGYGMAYSFYQPFLAHPRPAKTEGAHFELFPTLARNPGGNLIPGLAARMTF